MSHYYQKIEIDYLDQIMTKCLAYVKTQEDIYFQKQVGAYRNLNFNELITACPELSTAFDRYDIKCTYSASFILYTTAGNFVHIDAGTDQARINIPLENCQNTFTEFYEGGKSLSYTNSVTGTTATRIIGAKLVDQVEIDQATVIRVKAAHSVRMDENHAPRVTLTLGFDRDPVFLLDN